MWRDLYQRLSNMERPRTVIDPNRHPGLNDFSAILPPTPNHLEIKNIFFISLS